MTERVCRISRFGKEWHVNVYQMRDDVVTSHVLYVLGRNDGRGPRSFKSITFWSGDTKMYIPLPKKFADAMMAYVQMRGET